MGGLEIEGCDFLHVGEDGSVAEFVVMVRPLSGRRSLTLVEEGALSDCLETR